MTSSEREAIGELEPVDFEAGQTLVSQGAIFTDFFFITSGLISLVWMLESDQAGLVGVLVDRTMLGIFGLLHDGRAPGDYVVTIAGSGLKVTAQRMRDALAGCSALEARMRRLAGMSLADNAQIAVCNSRHNLQQRLCRWLLVAWDANNRQPMHLPADTLAMMAGATRPRTVAAFGRLAKQNLVHVSRGRHSLIEVRNRSAIENMACECYQATAHRVHDFFSH